MPWIDFKQIKEMVTLEDVLGILEHRVVRRQIDRGYSTCPLNCSPRGRACSFDFQRKLWFCHVCKKGGCHVDLYAQAKGLTFIAAALELCLYLHLPLPTREAPVPGAPSVRIPEDTP
jgi:hypothetical protein